MNGEQQPGSVISPGGAGGDQVASSASSAPVAVPTPQVAAAPAPQAPMTQQPVAAPQVTTSPLPMVGQPQFLQSANTTPKMPKLGGAAVAAVEYADGKITWTASEYIDHPKSSGWFVLLGIVVLGLASIVYLWTKDVISVVAIVVMGGVFGYYAGRKPSVQSYVISDDGISSGAKKYLFADIKSFSVAHEGVISSIVFLPMKRFALPVPIYCAPEQEDEIIEALTQYLPYEEHKQDVVDRFSRRIRF